MAVTLVSAINVSETPHVNTINESSNSRSCIPDSGKVSEEFGYEYVNYQGIKYPPFIVPATVAKVRSALMLRDSDIVVATYPKCGTTWMQQLVLLLLNNGDINLCKDPMKLSPWIEKAACTESSAEVFVAKASDDSLFKRRCWKTHAPAHLVPWHSSNGAKIIVVTRNSKDAAVSMYHHARDVPSFNFKGPWPFFARMFLKGDVEHGSYWDWHLGWWNLHQTFANDILWVAYEDMKTDLIGQVARVAQFLQIDCDRTLAVKVAQFSEFAAMKSQFAEVDDIKLSQGIYVKKNHIREGKVGTYRQLMSEAEIAWFTIADEAMSHIPVAMQPQ